MKLTVDQRQLALGLFHDGTRTIHQLSVEFKCSKRTIKRLIERASHGLGLADKSRSGRPPMLTEHIHRTIGQLLRHDNIKPTKQIALTLKDHGLADVSSSTVLRYLKSRDWISAIPTRKPPLTDLHKQRRVAWARKYKDFDWSKTIVSDESIFQTNSNRLRHWGKIRKFCYRKRYVPQQMIWGAISARGTVGIYFLEEGETVTADLYVEKILEGVLHPNAHALFGEDFTFQQDNATPVLGQYGSRTITSP